MILFFSLSHLIFPILLIFSFVCLSSAFDIVYLIICCGIYDISLFQILHPSIRVHIVLVAAKIILLHYHLTSANSLTRSLVWFVVCLLLVCFSPIRKSGLGLCKANKETNAVHRKQRVVGSDTLVLDGGSGVNFLTQLYCIYKASAFFYCTANDFDFVFISFCFSFDYYYYFLITQKSL